MEDETLKLPPHDVPLIAPPGANDLSGSTFGGYKLVRKIATGGMGVIYEAVQTKLDRKVALKILTEPLAARPEFFQRFEREAKAAAALNHPNVVQVHDFGEADGRHFIIMEFVEGQNLSAYVAVRGRLPAEEALNIIEQAARALKAAAEKSIVHRDIKPSNLMLTRNGVVKVADLGLAKVLTQDSELTMSNIVGSPHFIAPEQAADSRNADHRVDIYSLGITLFFLLTGKYPYDGNSPISIVLAHTQKPLPSAAELGVQIPAEVEALIHRMAAKNPDERYQDYDSLLADLQLVKSGYAPMTLSPQPHASSPFAPKTSRREMIASICIVAGILIFATVLTIWILTNKQSKKEIVAANSNPPQQSGERLVQVVPATPAASRPETQPQQNQLRPQQPQNNFQPMPPQQNGNDNHPLMLLIGALDANHDRMIDANEMANANLELKALDKNGDGKLESNEYLTPADLAGGQYKQFRIYIALRPDANSTIEIASASVELKQLDVNGNGQLDPQEFGPAGAPPPNAGGNPRGGPPPSGGMQGERPPPQ